MLICNDGAKPAEKATSLGAVIAAACGAEVTLLGIIENPGKTDVIRDALRRGLQLLEDKQIRAELVTITGQPVEEIIKRTEAVRFDLVVIGAMRKGTAGPFWMSSKTYRIIKSIQSPVLVVVEKTTAIKRILICTGGKKYIGNAVDQAGRIARGMEAFVTLLHVMPEPPAIYARLYRSEVDAETVLNSKSELGRNLRDQRETLKSMGVAVEIKLRQGSVLPQIFEEIQHGNYDLVVTGSAMSPGRFRVYILGDVTREIVNRAGCAVLVVRAGMTASGIIPSLAGWIERIKRRSNAGT